MCPACMASLALILAGSGSAGGLTAFVVKKMRAKTTPQTVEPEPPATTSPGD